MAHRTFDGWTDELNLEQEIAALEKTIGPAMAPAAATPAPVSPGARVVSDDLARRISDNILARLRDDEFLDKFLRARELQRDNQLLASQVKHLLREKKQLEAMLASHEDDLRRYKAVVGNIYLKID
ncbi:MAG: hypothetical protein IPK79_06835 [Vampirovibrionales bacterium]|nr:hypothetical protein [Vampirovibrionales bacterium]